jgi:hypothetical protein
MDFHQVDRLPDHLVLPGLAAVAVRGRRNDAAALAFIAVADERKLFAATGYSSMYQYCLGELQMSEDAAAKRIQAARVAKQFPALFDAVSDGGLHLSAVVLLAPHLKPSNAAELIAAATHKTKSQIECLLAERFPKPDLPTLVMAVAPAVACGPDVQDSVCATREQHAPGHVGGCADDRAVPHAGAPASPPAPAQPESPAPRPKLTPLAPQRFGWQLTVSGSTNDKLQYARELLGHAVPQGEVAEVLDRALDALIETLEKRIFAAGSRTRPGRGSADPRHVPAAVKHDVWVRDGGRCAFVSDKGRRCESRTRLQYDHVTPVARGGCATVNGMRLLCAAHNQHAAERVFGKRFMHEKREAARGKGQEQRRRVPEPRPLPTAALDVVPRLHKLGFGDADARGMATRAAEALPDASLEQRVHHAVTLSTPADAPQALRSAGSPG